MTAVKPQKSICISFENDERWVKVSEDATLYKVTVHVQKNMFTQLSINQFILGGFAIKQYNWKIVLKVDNKASPPRQIKTLELTRLLHQDGKDKIVEHRAFDVSDDRKEESPKVTALFDASLIKLPLTLIK